MKVDWLCSFVSVNGPIEGRRKQIYRNWRGLNRIIKSTLNWREQTIMLRKVERCKCAGIVECGKRYSPTPTALILEKDECLFKTPITSDPTISVVNVNHQQLSSKRLKVLKSNIILILTTYFYIFHTNILIFVFPTV